MAAKGTPTAARPAGLKAVAGDVGGPLALDRVIHERVRLAIVSALAVHEVLTFNELKSLLDASDGNLSVHARKLEEAGYVSCKKGYDGRVPRTEYRITAAGSGALSAALTDLRRLVDEGTSRLRAARA